MYRSLRGIVKYKFNGIASGIYKHDLDNKMMNELDVFAIESMRWRKRFFMINDKDHPFVLHIVYTSCVTRNWMSIVR